MDWLLSLAWLLSVLFGQWTPKVAEIWIERGWTYSGEGNQDQAIEAFSKAVRLDPKNWSGYAGRGHAYLHKGDWQCVVVDYSEALRLLPKSAEPFERARILSERGNAYFAPDAAPRLTDQDEVIRLVPTAGGNYFDRAQTHVRRKDYQRALADFTHAIRLEPSFVFAYTCRAGVYEELLDYQRAAKDLREAARCDPQDMFDTHMSLAWMLATCPDAGVRDGRDALRHARKACRGEGWEG